MTFEEVHAWCRSNGVDARGVYRGKDFVIHSDGEPLPKDLPSVAAVFHWDVQVDGRHLPTSPSDMERLVTGQMTLDVFKGTIRSF